MRRVRISAEHETLVFACHSLRGGRFNGRIRGRCAHRVIAWPAFEVETRLESGLAASPDGDAEIRAAGDHGHTLGRLGQIAFLPGARREAPGTALAWHSLNEAQGLHALLPTAN